MKRNDKFCDCIALYNTENSLLDFEAWYNFALNLAKVYGHNIKIYVGITGSGFSGKYLELSKVDKKLRKKGFVGIQGITVVGVPVDSDAPTYDWLFHFSLDYSLGGNQLIFCIENNLLRESLKQMMLQLVQFGAFCYGIAYKRLFSKGPDTYAMGGIEGKITDEEINAITLWNNNHYVNSKKSVRNGLIRDVYSLNILNSSHLNFQVHKISFSSWVDKNTNNGKIENIGDGLFVWFVNAQEIPRIKVALCDMIIK